MKVLVDSNVLIDLFARNNEWYEWSSAAFDECINTHDVVINSIIYAEVSAGFARREDLDAALYSGLQREEIPWEAAFLAGQCFLLYRKRGGARHSPLPDFFIGAHALVKNMTLLTRDATRYRDYFPKLKLIAPR